MCGIFGFVLERQAMEPARVKELVSSLVVLSETRGKEAAGLAVRNDRSLTVCKSAMRGTAFLRTSRFADLASGMFSADALRRSPVACLGHTRLVTNGSMERHENNQPVVRGGIVGIHNGIIVNDASLFAAHGIERACDVDTEALLALVEEACMKGATLAGALSSAFCEVRGTASVALLFDDAPVLALATNNGSLYVLPVRGGLVFGSERYILEQLLSKHPGAVDAPAGDIAHVPAGTGMLVDLATAERSAFALTPSPDLPDVRRGGAGVAIVDVSSDPRPPSPTVRNAFAADGLAARERIFAANAERVALLRRCSRCILPETMPFIEFDGAGICNFCRHYKKKELLGEDALLDAVELFRGDGTRPDCLFPLSGGRDSSYGLHYAKTVLKLTPIAYSYDWGMLTDLGRRNQARMCGELGVEHLLISADIGKKRGFIRNNVLAWLSRPDLGTVPLFMAGDKQYFYHLNRLKKQVKTGLTVYCENPLEQTNFKYGFCGVPPKLNHDHVYRIGLRNKLAMAFYYAKQTALNPGLFNASVADSAGAFLSTYFLPHDYVYLFNYIRWDEAEISRTLTERYDWELASDTATTWRIGDGTAAFYNYIYYTVAGFTENDTFRSNQVREGMLSRGEALALAARDNCPRWASLEWYGDTVGIDMGQALDRVDAIPKLYA